MKELGKKSLNGNIADCEYCDIKNTFKTCSGKCDKEELPKTEIDWSGFPKSTQEQVGFIEPNIIDEWLDKNGSPEIAKQVKEESKELYKKYKNEK